MIVAQSLPFFFDTLGCTDVISPARLTKPSWTLSSFMSLTIVVSAARSRTCSIPDNGWSET